MRSNEVIDLEPQLRQGHRDKSKAKERQSYSILLTDPPSCYIDFWLLKMKLLPSKPLNKACLLMFDWLLFHKLVGLLESVL